jgi:hypothetical protein
MMTMTAPADDDDYDAYDDGCDAVATDNYDGGGNDDGDD